jgi:hypothetical protein
MSFRVTQSMLALMLVLGCALSQATAQGREPAKPQASLWSVLNLPKLGRLTTPAKLKPKSPMVAEMPTVAEKKRPPAELNIEMPTVKPPPEPPRESAISSAFSPTTSSRRGMIQKRELAHDKSTPSAELNAPPSQPPVTPHWTPKFVEQAACLQLSDEECARPVAVNMAGDLISQRVTVARAVARLDPTLSVAPSVAHAIAKSDSATPTPAVQLATASPAAEH